MRFTIATYNIHKGFSHLKRRMVIHELRDKLRRLDADILFLQEVQGVHEQHASRYHDWPVKPQHEFIADKVWQEVAYGKTVVHRYGHHGNAVLSRFPIVAHENQDISAHQFESRGMLHCEIKLSSRGPALHCINVHLGLFERGRQWQVKALCERIRATVPKDAPLIVAGDFNDWRHKANRTLVEQLGVEEVFESFMGRSARTFPSVLPMFRLDRIYARRLTIADAQVHYAFPWGRASDHAALAATFETVKRGAMNRFIPGNRITLLRSGSEYFPALLAAIDGARHEVWLETYIFADDEAGRRVADALIRAAQRDVSVRLMVDGWGAKYYLTAALEKLLREGGVLLLKYRPEVAPWQFRSHRLRRLHRKICHVDGHVAFVGGINVIDDMNTPHHKPPRVDFAISAQGPVLVSIVQTMQRVWAINELVQEQSTDVPFFPPSWEIDRAGTQTAKFVIRDNLRHRRDIEHAYLAAIRVAKEEILIANSYFFPGIRFRRELISAAQRGVSVTLLLQARVEYVLLHFASRALYGQLLAAGVTIQEFHRSFLHAKVAVIDHRWSTVGSSNIDPYSLLMSREANIVVRDREFAAQLRAELTQMIETGARRVRLQSWARRPRLYKAANWIAYGIVRLAMGLLGYGGNEWWRGGRPPRARRVQREEE